MRAWTLLLTLIVLLPAAHSTQPTSAGATTSNPSNGDLIFALAKNAGLDVHRPSTVNLPPGATVPNLVMRLGERAGASVSAQDALAFAALDPRVATPVAQLLATIDAAWNMRDAAFSRLTVGEQRELVALLDARDFDNPRTVQLASAVDQALLVEAAILLLDTIDNIVVPQLQDAVRQAAWPPAGAWDNAGVLRLGSTGTDVETKDRIVQIDPRGDDSYANNAGSSNHHNDLFDDLVDGPPYRIRTPNAVSLDFTGNDSYTVGASVAGAVFPTQGAGLQGVGILLDYAGNDTYSNGRWAQGSESAGVGYLRDYAGNDAYNGDNACLGESDVLLAVLRDDAGDDTYVAGAFCGGAGFLPSATGLLWDRAGTDSYESWTNSGAWIFGYGEGGRGWLVDEGSQTDYYETATSLSNPHGCNDCGWSYGTGRGNDNMGGLGEIILQ